MIMKKRLGRFDGKDKESRPIVEPKKDRIPHLLQSNILGQSYSDDASRGDDWSRKIRGENQDGNSFPFLILTKINVKVALREAWKIVRSFHQNRMSLCVPGSYKVSSMTSTGAEEKFKGVSKLCSHWDSSQVAAWPHKTNFVSYKHQHNIKKLP